MLPMPLHIRVSVLYNQFVRMLTTKGSQQSRTSVCGELDFVPMRDTRKALEK